MKRTVKELFADRDWVSALAVASPATPDESFSEDEIQSVVACAMAKGDLADTKCVAIFKLRTGGFGYLVADCDTTGWDCQAGGTMGKEKTVKRARSFLSAAEIELLDSGRME